MLPSYLQWDVPMTTTTLPAAVAELPRSNGAFLLRVGAVMGGLVVLSVSLARPWGAGALMGAVAGGAILAMGLVSFGLWAGRQYQKVQTLMNTLTQEELVVLIGRDGDSWLSTTSVVHTLNRRFPGWQTAYAPEGQLRGRAVNVGDVNAQGTDPVLTGRVEPTMGDWTSVGMAHTQRVDPTLTSLDVLTPPVSWTGDDCH